MSMITPDAAPLESLACVGTVKILTKRDDGSLHLVHKQDKNGNPNLVMGLLFTADPSTTCPKPNYQAYVSVNPLIFDPKPTYDHNTALRYQKNNYEDYFRSANGGRALFECIFGDEWPNVVRELESMSNMTLNDDGTITDRTDWQHVAAVINEKLEGRLVGFSLKQVSEPDGTINAEGKKVYVLKPFYEIDPRGFFAWKDEGTKPPKGRKPTFGTGLPF